MSDICSSDKQFEIDVYKNVDNYSQRLIDIIKPSKPGIKVFGNRELLLNIFSYFKSGWAIRYQLKKRSYCEYYDIFNELVIINQVTRKNTNPYYDKGVFYEAKLNSYYVGPILEWYKSYNQYNDEIRIKKPSNRYKHK